MVVMGTKDQAFAALPPVTLEDLVPPDSFYRHLERALDLGFVRELVRDAYSDIGQPSIDPVVFFKLQLVLFFEGIRSARQLIATASLHLAHRYSLGYTLDEALPHHSSLTHIANTPARSATDPFALSARQSTAWGPLHSGDRTPIPPDRRT